MLTWETSKEAKNWNLRLLKRICAMRNSCVILIHSGHCLFKGSDDLMTLLNFLQKSYSICYRPCTSSAESNPQSFCSRTRIATVGHPPSLIRKKNTHTHTNSELSLYDVRHGTLESPAFVRLSNRQKSTSHAKRTSVGNKNRFLWCTMHKRRNFMKSLTPFIFPFSSYASCSTFSPSPHTWTHPTSQKPTRLTVSLT